MPERIVSVVVEWISRFPEVAKETEKKLEKMVTGVDRARQALIPYARTEKEQLRLQRYATESAQEMGYRILRTDAGFRIFSDALERNQNRLMETRKRLERFSGKLMTAGWRIGWLSFRLVMMGRGIMQWFQKPIQLAIKSLSEWDKSLGTVATSMGLLQATGMLTSGMADFLTSTMEKLPDVGLRFQAAMGELQSVLIGIVVEAGEPLIEILHEVALALLDVWNEVKPTLIPALQELANTVLPPLLDILRDVGPAVVIGLVEGIRTAIPIITGLLKVLTPILPTLARLVGFLLPFAPLLLAVGTAMYFLSPILMGLSASMSALSGVIGFLSGTFGICSTAAGGLGIAIGGVTIAFAPFLAIVLAIAGAVVAIILIWQHWGEIVAWFQSVLAPLAPLLNALQGLFGAIWNVLTGVAKIFYNVGRIIFELIRIAITPLLDALKPVFDFLHNLFKPILDAIGRAFEIVTTAIKVFTDALNVVGSVLHGVGDFLGGIANALGGLCFRHATPDVEKFTESLVKSNKEMGRTIGDLDSMRKGLEAIESTPVAVGVTGIAGRAAGAGIEKEVTQYMDISVDVTIGTVAGVADLDLVTEAVNKGVAEALRRRSY